MKKILITGAFGQLGRALTHELEDDYLLLLTDTVIPPNSNGLPLDITDRKLVKETLPALEPDLIVNLAAMTDVDGCESNPDKAWIVNSTSVQNLLDFGQCPLIHISSDYVFDGKNGPYKESDETNPINVYGETKLESEELIWASGERHLVIRTNVVYDYEPTTKASFLKWVVESLQKNLEINVVTDQYNNPTWASSLAYVIKRCIELDVTGLVHWGDKDYLNRYEFAQQIADAFGLNKKLIKPITSEALNQLALRPENGGVDSSLLSEAIGIEPPLLVDSLRFIKERFSE